MWQFIVSGYIPGTNIQVTYDFFELIMGVLSIGYLFRALMDRNVRLKKTALDTALTIKNIGVISVNNIATLRIL